MKSNNDAKKEFLEEAVLYNAIRLSRTKKKLTRDILSMMDGKIVERKKTINQISSKLRIRGFSSVLNTFLLSKYQ